MHYKDGTEAHVGDVVRGKTYNKPDEVIGVMLEITPGADTCNCKVSTNGAVRLGTLNEAYKVIPPGYGQILLFPEYDYSQCNFFERIK